MTIATPKPERPLKDGYFRLGQAPAFKSAVLRTSGKKRAGMIEGVSLIAEGEALGHEMWIDQTTLEQVSELANQGNNGVKSRFTHPGMSSDGLGRHLGRVQDVTVEGNKVVGDLHFSRAAHDTPDGNLAAYVMELVDDDPQASGLSIVFEHDFESEVAFMREHGMSDDGWDESEFESPDPNNVNNYPHVRVASLRAADIVDEPAANPDGMFDAQSLPREADAFLSYLTGATDIKPKPCFGIDPDRAMAFLSRWLRDHQFQLVPETPAVSDQITPEAPAQPTRDDFVAELKRYTDAFGAENGTEWFNDGLTFEAALLKHVEKLAAENEELREQLIAAKKAVADVELGEQEPLEVTTPPPEKKSVFRFTDASDN